MSPMQQILQMIPTESSLLGYIQKRDFPCRMADSLAQDEG